MRNAPVAFSAVVDRVAGGYQRQPLRITERKIVGGETGANVRIPASASVHEVDTVPLGHDHVSLMLKFKLVLASGRERLGSQHQEGFFEVVGGDAASLGVLHQQFGG